MTPHYYFDPFSAAGSQAFMLQDTSGNIQMSAQFSGICVSRDERPLTFTVACRGYSDMHITLTGQQIYSVFEDKCAQTLKRMGIIRKMYEELHDPRVSLKSTLLAGHKLWIFTERGDLVTLYFVRHVKAKKSRQISQLLILAADIKVFAPG
eukprot:316055-Prymnesium_polylepis.1